MNFSSMDYFIMVARERSFTRAAERLHITQQTLSAHIAALEKELGAKLLERNIPLDLTYAGEIFLEYALDLQRRVSALEHEFQDISHNQRGLLRIGITYTRGDIVMPPLLIRFQERFPHIAVRLVGDINGNFFPLLENGEIDLAIGPFPTSTPSIGLTDFYREELVLMVPKLILEQLGAGPGSPAFAKIESGDLSPLQECPFLMASSEEINGTIGYSLLRQSGVVPITKVESYNSTVKTQLILASLNAGACFCPLNMVRATLSPHQRDQLQLFHLSSEAHYMVRLAFLKQNRRWSVLDSFLRLAQEMSDDFTSGDACSASILRRYSAPAL